jgi:hypothetical protein
MDVHGKWTRIEGFDPESGEVVSFPRVPNDPEALEEEFSALEGPIHDAMEIGTNVWAMYWTLQQFVDHLKPGVLSIALPRRPGQRSQVHPCNLCSSGMRSFERTASFW